MPRVLVIEDEEPIRLNLRRILSMEGYEVLEASDGRSGLGLALSSSPDVILCDVMMPGMNGYAVLDALRADPAAASIPFVFLSASADVSDLQAGLERGADRYITKPFTIREILDVLAAVREKGGHS